MSLAPAPICGDRQRMRQLALVLIDNARRYAATGKFVRCTTGVHDEQPFLAIADKGPGFPSGIEAHGIDLLWRAEPSRARMTGGTGLGLSIAKAIARAHDGDVEIAAREGGGAVVTIRFRTAK